MNEGSKWPISWNNSRHVPSCRFYLYCEIEETCSPGTICILCHQVIRHPSECGTSSMGKHFLANAHLARLNAVTYSEVIVLNSSTVIETALAILKRQGSWGITIVSSQRELKFDIQFQPSRPRWQTKCSKLVSKEFEWSEFHKDRWNCSLMFGYISDYIPWNAISNLELQRSIKALRDDIVLPSATPLSNICQGIYVPTMDTIKHQLPSWIKVSIALDGWTSTNKLIITSVIA